MDPFTKNPIDHGHLARFTQGNRQLESEVLSLFANHLPTIIAQLHEAATSRDWRIAAHTLKGSARAVGAGELARLAEEAEGMPGPAEAAARERLIHDIEAAAAKARHYIDRLYNPA